MPDKMQLLPPSNKTVFITILIAALGYFVDVYDLFLFSIVRIASLRDLGVEENQLSNTGMMLLNLQMAGMLLGGILWGILADKKGRVSVLFSTILLYSLANIANAYVTSVEMYALLRFIAGIGLAGELGIGVTLVSEIMSNKNRGYGTAFVTAFGTSGAVIAAIVANLVSWKTAYLFGGCMGLLLLIIRVSLLESPMFNQMKYKNVKSGNIRLLFTSKKHFLTYINCILIGLPIWFIVGILISFSPELAKSLGITGDINAGKAVLFSQIGFMIGGFSCGILSQQLKSRKKAAAFFMVMILIVVVLYLFSYGQTPVYMYTLYIILGFSGGYWALFAAIAAEQFGTNLRATVATTAPNFVRSSVIITTFASSQLNAYFSLNVSILIVGLVCLGTAILALCSMKETYGENLDYTH